MTEALVEIINLNHHYQINKKTVVRALDDLSFQINRGEIFGLVGESGSGKSTLARCLMNIITPTSGQIIYSSLDAGNAMQRHTRNKLLQMRRQLVFQDSGSSLNHRMTVADIIAEPMVIHRIHPPRGSLRAEVEFQMHYVGLDPSYMDKYPFELSGGQRQRVAIARALSMEPELLVADESVASLDVSMQAQIINLFKHLQQQHGFTLFFITHDLAMVKYLCDRVGVLYQGKLVELATAEELFTSPLHPYTKSLISAMPVPDPRQEREREVRLYQPEPNWRQGHLRECSAGHFVLHKEGETM